MGSPRGEKRRNRSCGRGEGKKRRGEERKAEEKLMKKDEKK